jgi:hypothetical protein
MTSACLSCGGTVPVLASAINQAQGRGLTVTTALAFAQHQPGTRVRPRGERSRSCAGSRRLSERTRNCRWRNGVLPGHQRRVCTAGGNTNVHLLGLVHRHARPTEQHRDSAGYQQAVSGADQRNLHRRGRVPVDRPNKATYGERLNHPKRLAAPVSSCLGNSPRIVR